VESAALAQQQILQQADVAILSQANQQPTIALSLIG
jgi:flagellin-like hook-associated protein FlgL